MTLPLAAAVGRCVCCWDATDRTTALCSRCTVRTWCQCGQILKCSCGHASSHRCYAQVIASKTA